MSNKGRIQKAPHTMAGSADRGIGTPVLQLRQCNPTHQRSYQ
jgi:hypothetical protein